MGEDNKVEVVQPIRSYDDMQDKNSSLMEEIYNDSRLSPEKKMKAFSQGVNSQVKMSGDMQNRVKLLLRMGVKVDSSVKALSFLAGDIDEDK